MTLTNVPFRLLAVTAIAVATVGFLALIPHPALAVTISTADLSDVMGNTGSTSFFSWTKLLGFVMDVLVPIVAIVAILVLVNRLRDNPDVGNIVFSLFGIILVMGVAIAIFALPGKLNAAQASNTSGGALIAVTSTKH
jgi:hypothetical protein